MARAGRIFILVAVLWDVAVMATAQSLPAKPYEGATHTYVVNGLTPGTEYTFYMTSFPDGNGLLDDGSAFEFDFLSSTQGVVKQGEEIASVPVRWFNGAALRSFYLWIRLTNPEGCSVARSLHITPQRNMFDLLSENIPADHTQSCPQLEPSGGFNPLASAYDAGNTVLHFNVRREGGSKAWSFEPFLTIDPSWNLDVAIVSVKGNKAGLISANDSNRYVVPANDSEVVVTVIVKNLMGAEQLVTLGVRNQREEKTLLADSNPSNDQVQHRISVLPIISDLEEL
jgi:hypothetical protein